MQGPPRLKEHEWLHQLVGSWRYEGEAPMAPDQPPMKFSGRETVRSLGGLWTVGEWVSDPSEGHPESTSIMTLGFDPARGRFVGTFITSMMTHLWIYDGKLEGNTLTLDAEGPSFATPGAMVKYQDIIEVVDANRRVLRSQMLKDDATWQHFMTAVYTRT